MSDAFIRGGMERIAQAMLDADIAGKALEPEAQGHERRMLGDQRWRRVNELLNLVPVDREDESLAIGEMSLPDILHLYEKQRAQVRGVPWGTPVMRALRDLDDWTQAELVRKKTEACVVGIVLGADEAEQGVAPSVVDADGNRVEQFEPGLIAYARGGKDIKFNQPATTAGP